MSRASEILNRLFEDERAEGDIVLRDGTKFPYNTELASSSGVHMDIYMGDTKGDPKLNDYSPELKAKLKSAAKSHRDCVSFKFIGGTPTGYWAHETIRESSGEFHVFVQLPSRNKPYMSGSYPDLATASRACTDAMKKEKAQGCAVLKQHSTITPFTAQNVWNQGTAVYKDGNINVDDTHGSDASVDFHNESKGTVYFWLPNSSKAEEEEVEASSRSDAMAKIRQKHPDARNISCPMNDFKNESKVNEDNCNLYKITGSIGSEYLYIKGFSSSNDMHKFMNKQDNNDWQPCSGKEAYIPRADRYTDLKPGTYKAAGFDTDVKPWKQRWVKA